MRFARRRRLAWIWSALVALIVPLTSAFAADPVLTWNVQTTTAIQQTQMDPFMATRALALESIAVLDTMRSVAEMPGFMVRLSAPPYASATIASHAAAHAMLVHLFPARKSQLDTIFERVLRDVPPGPKRDRDIAFGEAVAAAIIAIRDTDGWNRSGTVVTGTEPGQWRPTPPNFLPPLNPQWALLTPFTMTRADQFRPPGPREPGTKAFQDALAETAALGAIDSMRRTPDQAEAVHFWSDAIGTFAPAGHWNAIAREVLRDTRMDPMREAALFAKLNIAIADAAIAMADAKYTYWVWRPITAIHSGSRDFAARPEWVPLLETPPHPSYISGHSAFSGAAAVVLTAEFGARPFKAEADDAHKALRSFRDFDQAAEEAANSRLWGGIHYRFDNDDGLATGRAVGRWALDTFGRADAQRAPVIVLDRDGLTGFALDRAAPLQAVNIALDGGTNVRIPVAADGRFTLPKCGRGQHKVTVTATGAGGLVTTLETIVTRTS